MHCLDECNSLVLVMWLNFEGLKLYLLRQKTYITWDLSC